MPCMGLLYVLMLFNFSILISMTGGCAWFIVSDAREEKAQKELEMRQAWIEENNVTEVLIYIL